MESFNLSTLNLYIRRVLALNFQDPVWVSAELLSLKEKNGHVYLELTDKDALHNITAQNTAIIWKNTFSGIKKSTQFDIDHILREGNEVRLLVNVDYNVRYGLKLIVQNLDSEFTYGRIAQSRLKTIEILKKEGIWQKNKTTQFPITITNIAVIGSKDSAGYKDFINHLTENQFKFSFHTSLFNVSVQGANSVKEISNAFAKLQMRKSKYDIIVLIRGGGSKHDLLEFDSLEIAKAISLSEVAVLTGIGHFIDESVADLSAYQALKTPTAVADFIISRNRESELAILDLRDSIYQSTKQFVTDLNYNLSAFLNTIINNVSRQMYQRSKYLTDLNYSINHKVNAQRFAEYKKVTELNFILESNDPDIILQKGYSLTFKDNILLSKCKSITEGDEIKTTFSKGTLTSKINTIWEPKN